MFQHTKRTLRTQHHHGDTLRQSHARPHHHCRLLAIVTITVTVTVTLTLSVTLALPSPWQIHSPPPTHRAVVTHEGRVLSNVAVVVWSLITRTPLTQG